MTRKLCVVTGTRAEYGLLRHLMKEIERTENLSLQLVVTGTHLSPEFGLTYREIEADGFKIDKKIEILLSSDLPVAIAKSMGLGLIGFAEAFDQLRPDLIIVLGDRYEILSAVSAALVARIPVAHIHGGEATEGLIDEGIRHAITKMSHLHFVAAKEYQNRVIQLGEQPNRVFLVGGLGVDGIKKSALLSKSSLEEELSIKFQKKNLLITFHPVTLEENTAEGQITELLQALKELGSETTLIFTMPNADTDGRVVYKKIEDFVQGHPNAYLFKSLGQLRYLSCLQFIDAVIGNSSSGLTEVPTFKKGTINIGDRQRGRLEAASVINCQPNKAEIKDALNKLYSSNFQAQLSMVVNPYGEGGSSEAILKAVKTIPLDGLLKKRFYDQRHDAHSIYR